MFKRYEGLVRLEEIMMKSVVKGDQDRLLAIVSSIIESFVILRFGALCISFYLHLQLYDAELRGQSFRHDHLVWWTALQIAAYLFDVFHRMGTHYCHFTKSTTSILLPPVVDRFQSLSVFIPLMHLTGRYGSEYAGAFFVLLFADYANIHMQIECTTLVSKEMHRPVVDHPNNLVQPFGQICMRHPLLFAIVCYGNEIFFLLLYVLCYVEGPLVQMYDLSGPTEYMIGVYRFLALVTMPLCLFRQVFCSMQLWHSVSNLQTFFSRHQDTS